MNLVITSGIKISNKNGQVILFLQKIVYIFTTTFFGAVIIRDYHKMQVEFIENTWFKIIYVHESLKILEYKEETRRDIP